MNGTSQAPRLTVVLRAERGVAPLRRSLEALSLQSLPPEDFEVLVVTAPAAEAASAAARAFGDRLDVRSVPAGAPGVAAAHDLGLRLARGEIVLYLGDREVADPGLLAAHRDAHLRHPDPGLAVLGGLRLSDALAADPLMHFAAVTGCQLHAYPYVKDGDLLEFTSFWPERCSLKRDLPLRHGGFDPRFRRGDDHLELGFRLSAHGFRVLHAASAVATLVDGYGIDELWARLRDEGASRYLLARLHEARAAREAAGIEAARAGWSRFGTSAEAVLRSARSLDSWARGSLAHGLELGREEVALLHRSYWAACTVSRVQGMIEQAAEDGERWIPGAPARARVEPGDAPPVSIVIPAYNQWKYTRACLEVLSRNTPPGQYELIVVDNASRDETAEELRKQPPSVRVLTNAVNTGFVGACNRGAAAARGRWILFLNNDTEPTPGWLDALLRLADADPEIGAVGSQLVYGDGSLQEAGAIVFRDGSGWNFGRGDVPARPMYRRACEVDYCSGAALMVRRDVFERLGGFDPRFSPGYYEDTDLCFAVRSLGLKVMYCPESVVVHFEGITNGTDPSSGMKRYQVLNRAKFVEKWREALARHEPSPTETGRRPITADRTWRLAQALLDGAGAALRAAHTAGSAPANRIASTSRAAS